MGEHRLEAADVQPGRSGSRIQGLVTTWTQVKAYFWLRTRTGYALTLRNTSSHFDLAKWVRALPVFALVIVAVAAGGAFVYSLIRPAGVVGESRIVVERSSGELFVNVDGRLHPTLNLASARLIAGTFTVPTGVSRSAIDSWPRKGPVVGIPGAPDEMAVSGGASVSAAVCQRTPLHSLSTRPMVTVLDGGIEPGVRADELGEHQAVVAVARDKFYLVWHGAKSAIDVGNRVVLSALGVDGEAVSAARRLSDAVADAIPLGLPLVEPVVPEFGEQSPWSLGAGSRIGSVVQAEQPGAGPSFFVVLRDGVQEVSRTVASMLRSRDSFGSPAPAAVTLDALASIPRVRVVETSQYPPEPVVAVATRDKPVLCWWWRKGRSAQGAEASVLTGAELPISPVGDSALIEVVGAGRPDVLADAVYLGPGASNYLAAIGSSLTSGSREAMWWVSPWGTRFGLDADERVRSSLGLNGEPMPMPWVLLRLFPRGLPAGVSLSKEDAMTKHDRIAVDPRPGALVPANG